VFSEDAAPPANGAERSPHHWITELKGVLMARNRYTRIMHELEEIEHGKRIRALADFARDLRRDDTLAPGPHRTGGALTAMPVHHGAGTGPVPDESVVLADAKARRRARFARKHPAAFPLAANAALAVAS
jgi:hypothetical protein